jgi:hypothetical protein
MSFIEKLRNANTLETYLAELKVLIQVLMSGKTLLTVAREGKTSFVVTEPGYLKYPNQLLAVRRLIDEKPAFEGFTYKLVTIQPKFKIANPAGGFWFLDKEKSCSVPCTDADIYSALEMSWA